MVADSLHVTTSASQTLDWDSDVIVLAAADPASHDAINLTGSIHSQMIIGNAGENILNGGGGADTLIGLGGNDTYLVRGLGDVVEEANGGGNDIVFTTVNYNLGDSEVEFLSTVVQADTDPINLVGNFYSSVLIGNYGNNLINGGYGADTLIGLKGDDTYVVYDSGSQIVEHAGEGNDIALVGVNYHLQAGSSVELLAVQNGASTDAFVLEGNELGQTIRGAAGADTIDGGAGADLLLGGAGADHFRFSTALGGGNVDGMADFTPGTDHVSLSSGVFTALAGSVGHDLSADNFALGKAADANDFIIYDQPTGQIFYDADGSGAGAAMLFAVVAAGTALSARDFEVVAPPAVG